MPTKLSRYREVADAMAVRMRERGEPLTKAETARAGRAIVPDPCPGAPAAVIAAHVRDYLCPNVVWDWAPALFASAVARCRLYDLVKVLLPAGDRGYEACMALNSCMLYTAAADLRTVSLAARAIVARVTAAHADWLQRSGVPADERAYFPPPNCGAHLGAAFGSDMRVPPQFVSSTARHLADVIYREETWTVLPILADALQDMGAPDDAAYITYLRGAGPFFRGCLAVDSCRGVG
jgi:hypothetical protein